MLLNRRSVLAGALLPLVPEANSGDHELLLLGAQLEVLQRREVALRRAGLDGTAWAKWNEAVVASVALAERIGRTPALDVVGFSIKLGALACEWEDDLEEHQLRRLRELAGEMQRAGESADVRPGAKMPLTAPMGGRVGFEMMYIFPVITGC